MSFIIETEMSIGSTAGFLFANSNNP